MLYVAYLDEFGHIGPYISKDDPKHNTSPVFGLGGIVLPHAKVRQFATFFFKLKNDLLSFEIGKSGCHPAKWEKKGSALFTTKNVEKYPELRRATNRLLSWIEKNDGFIFYVGIEKRIGEENHSSEHLYKSVLLEAIKRLDQECDLHNDVFMIILDQQDDMQQVKKDNSMRAKIVEASAVSMFGADPKKNLIEPPIQAESHLFQTLQCADWICGLIGRLACHQVASTDFESFNWATKYFGARIKSVARRSGIRRVN